MKSRLLIIAAILIVLGVGLWVVMGGGDSQQIDLVPAWLLTPQGMYSGDSLLDPTMSWSPDSKSLLVAAKSNKTSKPWILRWNVGEKQLDRVAYGTSPNYTDKDTFLYLIANPCIVVEHSFSRGTDRAIITNFEKVDFWKDITSFSYVPARKTLALRFSTFTRYYEPGLEEVDLTGKPMGKLPRMTGNGVLDRGTDPENRQVAEIIGELTGGERILQVSLVGATSGGKQIASGDLGAVAWSPDGRIIAFADSNEVKVTDPAGAKIITVGRFTFPSGTPQPPYVCRLAWSPDSKYLAAIQLVPNDMGGDMMAYVLDMSKLKM
jgi:WD40 repeat protein